MTVEVESAPTVSTIEPLFDRVLLKEDAAQEVTAAGIIIPKIAQEQTKTSTVIAVGPECKYTLAGDHVVHTKYAGTEFELNREKYVIVAEGELMGKIKG